MSDVSRVVPNEGRRRFLVGVGGAAVAGSLGVAGLATPAAAAAGSSTPIAKLPTPKPIGALTPAGAPAPFDLIRWLLPGPPDALTPFIGLPGFGLDVDPSTISDFDGFTAFSVVSGEAHGSDGNTYDVEFDMRIMQGTYVAEDGSTNYGTFAFL